MGISSRFQYLTDLEDPELSQAVSEGRRHEFAAFGWAPEKVPDPQALGTFLRSTLDWKERHREPHASLLNWHHRLIQLRQRMPARVDGRLDRMRVTVDEEAHGCIVTHGPVIVACNLATRAQRRPVGRALQRTPGHVRPAHRASYTRYGVTA